MCWPEGKLGPKSSVVRSSITGRSAANYHRQPENRAVPHDPPSRVHAFCRNGRNHWAEVSFRPIL